MKKSIKQAISICFYLFSVSFGTAELSAQPQQPIQPLQRGDTVPDYLYTDVFNHTKETIRLSEYKGKLVIVDFWGMRCISCIQSFPLLDSLQKRFSNDMQIILVNRESKDSTENFFRKRKKLTKPGVPFITSNNVLEKLFPHQGVPYHVWIDPSGAVMYLAASQHLSAENIQAVLHHEKLNISDKKNRIYASSFFDERWQSSLKYGSYITSCDMGVRLEASQKMGSARRVTYGCKSIIQLYQAAFNGNYKGQYRVDRPGRTFVETKDSARFFRIDKEINGEWRERNCYNYQLLVPEFMSDQIYPLMKADLDRFFRCESSIEKREVSCYVLIKTGDIDAIKTKGGTSHDNFRYRSKRAVDGDPVRRYYNLPFTGFSLRLGNILENLLKLPYADSVNYPGNIDIEMSGDTLDQPTLQGLRGELQKYGLDLVERKCVVGALVIRSRKQ